MDANFLTTEEKALAVLRIRKNNTGILNRKIKWNQVRILLAKFSAYLTGTHKPQIKEAINPLQDPQGLLLFLIIFCNEVLKCVELFVLPTFLIDFVHMNKAVASEHSGHSRSNLSVSHRCNPLSYTFLRYLLTLNAQIYYWI